MLLERNQAVIGAIMAIVLVVGTVFAVGASGGLFKPGEEIEAEFADAAGLGPGDFVTVAGIRVGEVLSVEIDGDVARTRFTLNSDGVPSDSTANIYIRNTLGKRAIALEPGTSTTYLTGGDVIPVDRTRTPVDLPELGDRSAELLGEVNVDALQSLITSLADITEGNRQDVDELLDGLQRVTKVVADKKDDLGRLIEQAEILIDAAADKDQEIVRIIDAFGSTLDRVATRRVELQRLLAETATASDLSADLLEERRAQLDRILFELAEDLEIVDDHQVDLAHALAYAGVGVDGFASIGYQNGPAENDTPHWGNVFVTGLGQAGVGALLGCGGALDQALTDALGPDPSCEEVEAPGGADDEEPGDPDNPDGGGATTRPSAYRGLSELFRVHGGTR